MIQKLIVKNVLLDLKKLLYSLVGKKLFIAKKSVVMEEDFSRHVMMVIRKVEMDAVKLAKLNQDGHVLAEQLLKEIHVLNLFQAELF